MDEPQGHFAKGNKQPQKVKGMNHIKTTVLRIHLYEVPTAVGFTETESRMVAARAGGRGQGSFSWGR